MSKPWTLQDHPVHQAIYDLCQQIEKCGASTELTTAVTMAAALQDQCAELCRTAKNTREDWVKAIEVRDKAEARLKELEGRLKEVWDDRKDLKERCDYYAGVNARALSAEARVRDLEAELAQGGLVYPRDYFAAQATEQDIEAHRYTGITQPEKDAGIFGRTREQARYHFADAMLAAKKGAS